MDSRRVASAALRRSPARPHRASRGATELLVAGASCALALVLAPAGASAFCGFYVSGAEASLYNDATLTVLMRDGTRTVISMRNAYEGPPEDFAMVVPVPTVLSEDDVRTLDHEIFDRVDRLSAPRLVEYWEQDPCQMDHYYDDDDQVPQDAQIVMESSDGDYEPEEPDGVTVEAEFAVGEYEVQILGARHSAGLDRWLRRHGYRIPDGAEAALRPYVQMGMKFFVAKVSVERVRRVPSRSDSTGDTPDPNGRAVLSPLRFHYDSEDFSLPVRLGMLNSNGVQDLLVVVLARQVRYEVANYDNYAIPTNLDVSARTPARFGEFYAAMFDRITELRPRAVFTEYAWSAASCDPCPDEPLSPSELVSLGADVIPSWSGEVSSGEVPYDFANDFVLTRLHVRYDRTSLAEDLVFRPAPGINGGQGTPVGPDGELAVGVHDGGSYNAFQGRYVVRHAWDGPIECEEPQRGVWGGPPPGLEQESASAKTATDTAFAARGGIELSDFLGDSDLESATNGLPEGPVQPPAVRPGSGGCASCAVGKGGSGLPAFAVLGVLLLLGYRVSSRR